MNPRIDIDAINLFVLLATIGIYVIGLFVIGFLVFGYFRFLRFMRHNLKTKSQK